MSVSSNVLNIIKKIKYTTTAVKIERTVTSEELEKVLIPYPKAIQIAAAKTGFIKLFKASLKIPIFLKIEIN